MQKENKEPFKKTLLKTYLLGALVISLSFPFFLKEKLYTFFLSKIPDRVVYYVCENGKCIEKEAKADVAYKELKEKISLLGALTKEEKFMEEELENLKSLVRKKVKIAELLIVLIVILSFYAYIYKKQKEAKEIFEEKPIYEEPLEKVGNQKFDEKLLEKFLGKTYEKYIKNKKDLLKIINYSVIADKVKDKAEFEENKIIFVVDEASKDIENVVKDIIDFGEFLKIIEKKDKEKFEFAYRYALFHAYLSLFGNVPSSYFSYMLKDEYKDIKKFISHYIYAKEIVSKDLSRDLSFLFLIYRKYKKDVISELYKKYMQVYIDRALLPEEV